MSALPCPESAKPLLLCSRSNYKLCSTHHLQLLSTASSRCNTSCPARGLTNQVYHWINFKAHGLQSLLNTGSFTSFTRTESAVGKRMHEGDGESTHRFCRPNQGTHARNNKVLCRHIGKLKSDRQHWTPNNNNADPRHRRYRRDDDLPGASYHFTFILNPPLRRFSRFSE